MKHILMLCSILSVALASAPVENIQFRQSSDENQLISPIHYDVEVTPYFVAEGTHAQFTFDGKVTMEFTVLAHLQSFFLNVNEITITRTILENKENNDDPTIEVETSTNVDEQQFIITTNLEIGINYTLTLDYIGRIGEAMSGFYRSYYMEGDDQKWIGTTQFQSYGARKAFPCLDEPGYKSTFQLTINSPSTHTTVLSNTNIENDEQITSTGRKIITFKKTPKMSTYLIAFIVSSYTGNSNNNKDFTVYSRPEAINQTNYALLFGQKILIELDKWFNIPYQTYMEKMDMAAIPDFSAGAMENWGLLTYRETALLYDEGESSATAKQRVATVITHEQVHMWFGDLVTCDKWEHVWLNEGFAAYFQFFATALVETNWDLELQYTVDHLQPIMGSDALTTTIAMSALNGGSINYNKASAVIRMTEHHMGKTNFKTALQNYLSENALQSSTPKKLFDAFDRYGMNITEMIENWTTQQGFPVVTISLSDDRKTVYATQKRFLIQNKNHQYNTKWNIPLTYVTSNGSLSASSYDNTITDIILKANDDSASIVFEEPIDWIIFNVQQTGYYRVNYDETTWKNIGKALTATNHSNIHVLNRAQIIDDVMNLARGDLLSYDIALPIFQYLENEHTYFPWVPAYNAWSYIVRRFSANQLVLAKKYILLLINKMYEHLTFEQHPEDRQVDIYSRMNMLSYACKYGHTDCVSKATEAFLKLKSENVKVHVNNRPVVYCTGIAHGDQSDFDFLYERYKTHNVAAEQVVILTALGCSKISSVIHNYITKIASDEIRPQDKSQALTATYSQQEENVEVVFSYIIANTADVIEKFGVSQTISLLSGVAARFTNEDQIDRLNALYNSNKDKFGVSTTIENAIMDAEHNVAWGTTNLPTITKYMEEISGASTLISSSCTVLLLGCLLSYLFY